VPKQKQGLEDNESAAGEQWSEDELRASVIAYLEMQQLNRDRALFTKKKYYDALSEKFGRSVKSLEYRMQNISYVMALMGRDWLSGLKPAKNVGANVATQIEKLVAEVEGKPVIPVVAFEIQVRDDVKRKQFPLPKGNHEPEPVTVSVTQYPRDPSIKAWVLKKANGTCECCGEPAPFKGPDGFPYLEVHHVRKLAERGADTLENTVAVCPNCHRELHYGERAKELVETLYVKIARLQREGAVKA